MNTKNTKTEPTSLEIRMAMRHEARRQNIAPAVMQLIEANLDIWTEHLGPLESQERFLISQFLQTRPCPWCDSGASWFEALNPDIPFAFTNSATERDHRCPHCQKRILYALPFFGAWFWKKHQDDLNPGRVVR